VTLHVELVTPEGEIWAGTAELVIAKTLEGYIGVMTRHSPVLGIMTEGSVVRILPRYGGRGGTEDSDQAGAAAHAADEVDVAVSGGFFSVADDRVSILARQAQLGSAVDQPATRAALDGALQDAAASGSAEGGESAEVRYLRALLTAAGGRAGTG
jgi:F-type H+-transporting ATPase subunit epsilon